MARIDIYVHGRGRGHATRCAAIATRLRRDGHELRAFAGADAVGILRSVLPTCGVDSLPARARPAFLRLVARVGRACVEIARVRPDVIVSDGDLPALLAARMCGVPGVAVGHGLVFAGCVRPHALPRLAWWREAVKARVASSWARRRVGVGFVPLRVRACDFVLARATVPACVRTDARDVVVYFRDGIDKGILVAIRQAAPHARVFAPDVCADAERIDRAAFVAALAQARAVIASAGSQLIAECVAWGIPLLAVYAADDDEQRLNAQMLANANLGVALDRSRLDASAVEDFLARARSHDAAEGPSWAALDAADAVARACTDLLAEAGR
jgi:UDP:flavonoid glycosyltransferase YjiC (YdhE family)